MKRVQKSGLVQELKLTRVGRELFPVPLWTLHELPGNKVFFIVCKHLCIDITKICNWHLTAAQAVPKYIHQNGSKQAFGSPYEHKENPHLK